MTYRIKQPRIKRHRVKRQMVKNSTKLGYSNVHWFAVLRVYQIGHHAMITAFLMIDPFFFSMCTFIREVMIVKGYVQNFDNENFDSLN